MNKGGSNLRTFLAGGALSFVLILAISVLSVDRSSDLARRPSTFFTDDTGTRAIYLVLQEVLPDVGQWRRPLSDLALNGPPAGTTLVVMGPLTPLGPAEAGALEEWIESGGQLILAATDPWTIEAPTADDEDLEAEGDDFLSRHGIDVPAASDDVIGGAVTVPLGDGRIVFVPDAGAFSNASLTSGDRAVWMAEQAGNWGPTTWFDEYHLGFGRPRQVRSLVGAFLVSPWGIACLQFMLAAVVFLGGTKRRFGQPIAPLVEERTSPMEAVDALGGLFEAAGAVSLSARSIHSYVNLQLSSAQGRSIDLLDPARRSGVAERTGIVPADLDSYAGQVQDLMNGTRTSHEELIQMGRQAARITGSLGHGVQRSRTPLSSR